MKSSQVIKIAQRYIDQVRQDGVQVSAAYLYGSYAKGTPRQDSDIDVCVVSSQFGKDTISEMVRLSKVAHKVDDFIEPYPMNPEEFNEKYNPLAHEIRTHGIRLSI